jgi:hypothetical protein
MLHSLRVLPLVLALSAAVGCTAADPQAEPTSAEDAALTSIAQPTKLTDFEGGYGPIRTSATHIYFFDSALREIRRVPKAGGAVETVLAPKARVFDFALDATHLYAVVDRSSASTSYTFAEVLKAPLAGGTFETSLGGDLGNARIALDASDVYIGTRGTLARFPKTGAVLEAETLDTPRDLSAIAVDAMNVYWADMGPGNPAIGCNRGDGAIMAKPKRGGSARVVAAAQDCPVSLAIDGNTLWFHSFFGPLAKVPAAGGVVSTVAAMTSVEPAFDMMSVFYVSLEGTSSVLTSEGKMMPLTRTFVGTHTEQPAMLTSVAVDERFAYYVVTESGDHAALMRVAK